MWLLRGFWDEWKFLSYIFLSKVVVDFLATRLVMNDAIRLEWN